jgi:hypothetical protein
VSLGPALCRPVGLARQHVDWDGVADTCVCWGKAGGFSAATRLGLCFCVSVCACHRFLCVCTGWERLG